jgi:ribosome recycling factor
MEEAKVEIRNHRRDAVDGIRRQEKAGEIGADEAHRQQELVDQLTHKWTDEVDRVGAAKEAEVLEV